MLNAKKAIMSGMFCGTVLGSTGVGGGVLLLSVLNGVLQVDIKKAIGSSVVLALFCLRLRSLVKPWRSVRYLYSGSACYIRLEQRNDLSSTSYPRTTRSCKLAGIQNYG